MQELRKRYLEELSEVRMPTSRQEEYRFTDISPIIEAEINRPASDLPSVPNLDDLWIAEPGSGNRIVFFNGKIQHELSSIEPDLQSAIESSSSSASSDWPRGAFALLNGALFEDVLAIKLKPGTKIENPVHLLYLSSGDGPQISLSTPRIHILCEEGSKIEIVEEFRSISDQSSSHLTLPVIEISMSPDSELRHEYALLEGPAAFHVKTTSIKQAAKSKYSLVEASVGSSLSRHDIAIDQVGEETDTTLHHFHISSTGQTHDLHSKVKLDHVGGVVDQVHKCIVTAANASGVFDGNVKVRIRFLLVAKTIGEQVNRGAQQTDAGQISRNLLLVPKATVNVKPNLQIVADDVKCTHGCTVSDLSDEEVFYFRARGIDNETARRALIYSFGSEIVQRFRAESIKSRIDAKVMSSLTAI